MKTLPTKIPLLALSVTVMLTLGSCETTHYREASHGAPSRSGYMTYVSLPSDYDGDAYYYDNRYYAGGRYEPGRYTYRGRTYDHRYYHNGQYLYGGTYRQDLRSDRPQSRDRRSSFYVRNSRRGWSY